MYWLRDHRRWLLVECLMVVAALNLPAPEAVAQTLLQYFVIVDQVGTQRTNYG